MKVNNFVDVKQVKEAEGFQEFQKLPLGKIIKANWKLFTLCVILAGSVGSTNQFLVIFFGTYNFDVLGIIERSLMHKYISIAIIFYMVFSIVGGYLADKFGQYLISSLAVFAILILSVVLCLQINSLMFSKVTFIAIAGFLPFVTMPAAATFKQSIPIAIRYRVFALSHAIGSVIISAPTAFLSTWLYHKTKISWLPIVYFITTIIMIFFALYHLHKRKIID
ncbi:MAG: hypothetical protein Tsb006_3750 [Rickettsiaceae bacterium]